MEGGMVRRWGWMRDEDRRQRSEVGGQRFGGSGFRGSGFGGSEVKGSGA